MSDAKKLLDKYKAGTSTREEKQLVERWWLFHGAGESPDIPEDREQQVLEEMDVFLRRYIRQSRPVLSMRRWLPYAAAILFFILAGTLYYFSNTVNNRPAEVAQDIPPGGNRATLTFSGSHTIDLNTEQEGIAIAGDRITYLDGRNVLDSRQEFLVSDGSQMLSITTPKGGQYQVLLPDSTRVWLNAASSIRYPLSFSARQERMVELSGEAYFEVARGNDRPFRVLAGGLEVEVLGTHFNINSYQDEPMSTATLLEGSVRLNRNTVLRPGQQASLTPAGNIKVAQVNTSKAVAWKNGKFVFDNQRIEDIMRMLARWYDVEVVYRGKVRDRPFTGSVSRYENISRILEKMEFTENIHFEIKGRRITVMP